MKAGTHTGHQMNTTAGQEERNSDLCEFATNIGLALSAVAGLWGLSCLLFGLKECGVLGLLKSLFTAITGS